MYNFSLSPYNYRQSLLTLAFYWEVIIFMHDLWRYKAYFFISCLLLFSSSLYAFRWQTHKKIEVEYQPTDIILANGRILKDYVVSNDHDLFIPYELVETIFNEQLYWDRDNHTLHVGNIPTASVMSDKLKIYHYDYDSIHAFLYYPDAKTNKTMTMANETYRRGYYFTNVFSASFNLEGAYHEIIGFLGCEDFKASNGQVDFYLDDTLLKSYFLQADSLPEQVKLDVTGGSKLKLVFSNFKTDTQINFADVYIH